ncbi:MAG: cob(I)yrinic acid a,c-diamide adenosyltransferase [Candidatus Woesearchaeota archaeon]
MPKNLGLVHIYTGNGKGKSTTAFGMALRAAGQNLKVKIIQFLKGGHYTGEFVAIQNYMNDLIHIEQHGKPCLKEKVQIKLKEFNEPYLHRFHVRTEEDCGDCRSCFTSDVEEKEFVRTAFSKAKEIIKSGDYNLIFLDEINNCVAKGLIPLDDVLELIQTKPENTELILTGRNAPQQLKDAADLVTVMNEEKHPYNDGVYARRGIEF